MKMQEALLHYIWKHSFFDNTEYTADTGEKIKVLETGMHNHDGGPDFTNAKVMIDGTLWAGNVELHIKSSDWQNHGHHKNAAYDNVILHVVEIIDNTCISCSKRQIPSIKLRYNKKIERRYNELICREDLIGCSESLISLNMSLISFWLSALAIERLYSKTQNIQSTLATVQNNWEEAFYIHLARSFGLKINSVPFEMLAKSIPLKILAKHSNDFFQLEALLFGQAGFLEGEPEDEYQSHLASEYLHLKNKYQLKNIEVHVWKFLRLRPSNFPTIRIAEFCSLINNSKSLFSKILECTTVKEVHELFRYSVSGYWKNHYTFGKKSLQKDKFIGNRFIDSISVNVIIPFMFVYGDRKNIEELKDRAIRLLEEIAPENNNIIRKWKNYNIDPRHAADTQALLQLANEYCENKRCLECQIGNLILRKIKE